MGKWVYPKVVLDFNLPGRWGHSACYSQPFLYVFGGCCEGLHFSDVIVLNLDTMSWKTLSTTGQGPGPRDSHSAVLVGQRMIVFGGTTGSKKLNELHILDLDSKAWARPVCKGVPPFPRESHTATLVGDNELVVFGGSGEGEPNYLNDLHVLDLNAMRWNSPIVKGNTPVPRDSHSAVSVGRKIFVYGGDCGDRYEGDFDVFDMDTLTWSRIVVRGSAPSVRAGHAAVNIGPKVYVIGGVGEKHYYNDVWVFDINTCSWTLLEVRGKQPRGRFSHTAIVAGTDIAIFGGCGEDEHPVNELLVLQLGDEHPNGRYNNISLCKIFGKHLNSEKESPSRENGKYPKNMLVDNIEGIARKDDPELEVVEPKRPFEINSDVLQPKRKRMSSNTETLVIDSEPEENSLSLSQQSSPSQSDQEQTPIKAASPSQAFSFPLLKKLNRFLSSAPSNDVSIAQTNPKSFVRSSRYDPHFSRRTLNNTHTQQKVHGVQVGRCETQLHPSEQVSFNSAPSHNMVGAEVRGKVDGFFDSGYLMTATVNGKIFRGVLFPPGSREVSRDNTMAQNPSSRISGMTNVAQPSCYTDDTTPTLGAMPNAQYLRESELTPERQSSPIIQSALSNGPERKENADVPGFFLTLGGPGS